MKGRPDQLMSLPSMEDVLRSTLFRIRQNIGEGVLAQTNTRSTFGSAFTRLTFWRGSASLLIAIILDRNISKWWHPTIALTGPNYLMLRIRVTPMTANPVYSDHGKYQKIVAFLTRA